MANPTTTRWSYIRYRDGGEELCDHEHDPHEWHNLAAQADFAQIKIELAKSLPKQDAEPRRKLRINRTRRLPKSKRGARTGKAESRMLPRDLLWLLGQHQ